MKKPELVLPAGNLEKLKTAINFGADAVYLGGKDFSLRAAADNFTLEEIAVGLEFARKRGKKVYVTINILAHNEDIELLPPFLEKMEELQVDGLIISDPGVMRLAQQYAPHIPWTVSTQASVCNYQTAAFYRDLGARRLVLARELSLEEILAIKQQVDVELEIFVHGAMCVSYSGRCLLSYYLTGRSANRGMCAHPCRYRYYLVEEKRPGHYYPLEEDSRGSYILNSRDLCLLEYLPQLIEAGIDAFKVEGRMKSPLYVAAVARTYREAIDSYVSKRKPFPAEQLQLWLEELRLVATRPFTDGFLGDESRDMQDLGKENMESRAEFCGVVKAYDPKCQLLEVEQRANFGPGELIQLMIPQTPDLEFRVGDIFDQEGNLLDRARHPRQRVFLPLNRPVPEGAILRRI